MTTTDVELARAAALVGADVVRGGYGASVMRFEKGGGDFATDTDLDAERAIVAMIGNARPDDALSGEEGGLSGRLASERMWLVDPLCGTLNFAARTMLVAVNVAFRVGS